MAKAASRPGFSLAALVFTLLGATAGCGTDAKGIDTCREIEQERCRQAPACPDSFRVKSDEEVESCVRFYRDQCLHGTVAAEPGKPALDACLQTLRRAGACARSGASSLAECEAPVSSDTSLETACEVLVHPEKTAECAFLVPIEEPTPKPQVDAGPEEDAGEDDGDGDEDSDAG